MKALISPNEVFTLSWISSWQQQDARWVPVYSEILYCQRIAEVEPDNKIFEVAQPLHWVDCPENCAADRWYYKDGGCFIRPEDEPMPATPVEVLP